VTDIERTEISTVGQGVWEVDSNTFQKHDNWDTWVLLWWNESNWRVHILQRLAV